MILFILNIYILFNISPNIYRRVNLKKLYEIIKSSSNEIKGKDFENHLEMRITSVRS
jgi:hypothetical protein